MSQKTNPVSLRLQNSNKHFESCWYSDIFYHQVLSDEIQLRTYIESVFYQAGRSKTLPSLQSHYRRYCTFLFLLDTRGERHKREYSLKLSREPIQQVLSPKLKFLPNKNKPRSTSICALEKTSGLLFNGLNAFYKKVKGFSSFSMTSLALAKCVRGMPYKEEGPVKALALPLSVKQGLDRCEVQLQFGLDLVSEIQNTAFLKTKKTKKAKKAKSPTRNMFTVQSRVHENLFRRLIIDRSSQSTQNRLSYPFATRLKKQVSYTNTLFIPNEKFFKVALTSVSLMESKALLFEKIKTSEKTGLKNNTTCPAKGRWHRHTESFINLYSGTFGFATLYPVRAISPFQSAGFLIESVAYLLQRKSSFRQIKDDIFRELESLRQSQLIKGMRLSCAGRLGGRSKKAQKAKTQSAQWGETSLTVFSSRLAFASKGVSTAYGKVGVKIWLCYKS